MKLANLQAPLRWFKERWHAHRNLILLVSVATFALALVIGLVLTRNTIRRGWSQTEGALTLRGLRAPVTVVRDRYGVPHVYAANEADLYFAQGYVHAQDRFWGMELSRRRGRGTLAELLGDATRATDERWRALDLPAIARGELTAMEADARAHLDAYSAGVNAWLETQRLPFEFDLLRWRGRGAGDPAPWSAEDALIVSLVLSWQMGVSPLDPNVANRVFEKVGPERGAFLLSNETARKVNFSGPWFLQATQALTGTLPERWVLGAQVALVGGDRTESGQPLLALDLPTDLGLPAPWYVMAWSVAGEQVAGASVPGLPGLLVSTKDSGIWETWLERQRLALGKGTLPWQAWLLVALLKRVEVVEPENLSASVTVDDLRARMTDTFSPRAARLIPFLMQVEPEGWRQERVTGMLRKWDYRLGDNNRESPFFGVYQLELARAAFADELGADLFDAYVANIDLYQAALDRIIEDPDDEWWDDVTTPGRELRKDILKRAYEPALEWIGRNYGDLHMLWEWDIVHGSRLHHPLGDAWPWDQLLSRDLKPDGWSDTINASPGGLLWPCGSGQGVTETGGICQGGDQFRAKAVYGYRQILGAGDPDTLWFALLPGQSGQLFHAHYDDLMDEWLAGAYLPLYLARSPEEVEGADGVLLLTPQD